MPEPPRISALRPTNRDPNRSTVKVDGKAVGTLANQLIADLDLKIGSPWTDDLAERVGGAVVYDKAFRAATSRLARRAMSRGMLRQKLRTVKEPAPPEVIERVLDRLTELGFLDDRAFGEALIRETTRSKPAGPMLLRQKLMQKGVDRELIDGLVADATDDREEQADGATAFALKKVRSMQRLDPAARKRRLYGQLARRGFAPDAIRAAMAAALDSDG